MAAAHAKAESRSQVFDSFAGTFDAPEDVTADDTENAINIDSDAIFKMSDDDRMKVFNEIIDMVSKRDSQNEPA
jgi:hypothetical protein